jgi:predicted PurR-regulated permease PerM
MTNSKSNIKSHEIVISLTALVLFGVLFTVTELFKSPFIVFAVIIFVLYPFRHSKLIKTILYLSIFIFALWILTSISQVLVPFIVAFLISYALNPLVEKLSRKGMSRTVSALLIILSFLIVITLLIIFLAPQIVIQFSELIKVLPGAVNSLGIWLQDTLLPKLSAMGIPTQDIQNKVLAALPAKLEQVLNSLLSSLSAIFNGLTIILTQLVNLIMIPILTFYILKDFDNLKALVKTMLPKNNRKRISEYYHKVDDLTGSFIRGSIIAAIVHGIGIFIILTIVGIKYSIFLAALGVLLNLIPYFGLLVEISLSIIAALFSGNPGLQIPLLIGLYLLQNLAETSYLVPKIVGKRIGLHPALLILSLLVFSYFFGFIGLLIALPVSSIILMFFKEWLAHREGKTLKEQEITEEE